MAGDAVDPVEAEGRSSQLELTTRVDDSLCWFDMFNMRGERCGRVGRWHKPSDRMSIVRAMRWCDEHKHHDDVPLEN